MTTKKFIPNFPGVLHPSLTLRYSKILYARSSDRVISRFIGKGLVCFFLAITSIADILKIFGSFCNVFYFLLYL